jgi:type IV pilus assembly protein PilM
MASAKTAWGIEIGQYEVKAIQLEVAGDGVRVRDFWVQKHDIVLTNPELRADGAEGAISKARVVLEMTLSQLATQKKLEGSPVVLSFSWMQNRGFARFSKLPPVESQKQVESLVRYEAEQQIPFPLDEVEWDFHAFTSEDSPDVDVGIFAIQREPLEDFLALVSDKLGISPVAVTLSPVALYNAMAFDRDLVERNESLVLVDIGTSATDLIVADGKRCWMRTFPLGGHDFTEAITNEQKFSYKQADDLKQKSATSEHAKTIMSLMRPVLIDLVGDVQKSLGFYGQQNKEARLKNVLGLGSTLKIPGLRKFLGIQLNLEVERLDGFRKLTIDGMTPSTPKAKKGAESSEPATPSLAAADFAEYTLNFAVAYGLALQGLGMAAIDVNLLPLNRMRNQIWQKKQRWFAAAAAVAVAAGGLMFVRGILDNAALGDVSAKAAAQSQVERANKYKSDIANVSGDVGARSKNMLALLEDREVWPFIVNDAVRAVAAGNDSSAVADGVDLSMSDDKRRQTLLRDLSGNYKFSGGKRVIEVTLNVEANAGDSPAEHFAGTVGKWLQENAKRDGVPYTIDNVKWTYSKMKVSADGSLAAEESASAAAGGAPEAPTGIEGGNFAAPGGSFTAGGTDGGNNFGGLSGKRTAGQGGTLNRPGGRLGGTGAGGGFNAPGGNDDAAAVGGGDPKFKRGEGQGQDAAPADLDKLAPIPGRPGVFVKDSTIYVGKITFEVKLAGEVAAAAPAETPVEGQ